MSDPEEMLRRRAEGRIGAVLKGKYKLERLIGIGGMSAVYLAVHRNRNRVALKMLHLELSLDSDMRARFLQEGYAANNVDHPGVVRVLDDDTTEDGSTFVVMELLEGETLGEMAQRAGGALHPRVVTDAAHQLLDVLAAAQEKGVVHRDIKPHNLFITSDGALKLLDFGLARMMDAPGAHATVSGRVFGSPAYMPPEQALGRTAEIDHRSDIWAVGATMFMLLSGKLVHEAESATEHLVYAASRQARPLATAAPGVPPALAAIVDKALRFSREERWASARAMQGAIEAAYGSLFGAPPPPRRGGRVSQQPEGRRSSVPFPVAGMAGAAQSGGEPRGTWPPPGTKRPLALWAAAALGAAAIAVVIAIVVARGGSAETSEGAPPRAQSASVAAAPSPSSRPSESVEGAAAGSAPNASAAPSATGRAPTSSTVSRPRRGPAQKPKSSSSGAFDYQ